MDNFLSLFFFFKFHDILFRQHLISRSKTDVFVYESENIILIVGDHGYPKPNQVHKDLAERHDLKSRLLLFFSPFLFPPKKKGRRKGE